MAPRWELTTFYPNGQVERTNQVTFFSNNKWKYAQGMGGNWFRIQGQPRGLLVLNFIDANIPDTVIYLAHVANQNPVTKLDGIWFYTDSMMWGRWSAVLKTDIAELEKTEVASGDGFSSAPLEEPEVT